MREIEGFRFVPPDGAFYVYADISRLLGDRFSGSVDFSEYLLVDHAVAVVPGLAFGNDSGIRISYACSDEDIRKGMQRIREGVQRLVA